MESAAAKNQEPMNVSNLHSNQRQYPRKPLQMHASVFQRGIYIPIECQEISEGGLSFILKDVMLNQKFQVVLNFCIPHYQWTSMRAQIKYGIKDKADPTIILYGCAFENIDPQIKKQIRNYVAGRF